MRDGKPYPPVSVRETVIAPDAAASLSQLKKHGFLLIVITNQPDVRRGTVSREQIDEIHAYLRQALPLDDIFACLHDDSDRCSCRKPLPGLVLEAAAKYEIDVQASYLVGDRWRDIDAGAAAGCRTVFIDRSYDEKSPESAPDTRVSSLSEAVNWILNQEANVN